MKINQNSKNQNLTFKEKEVSFGKLYLKRRRIGKLGMEAVNAIKQAKPELEKLAKNYDIYVGRNCCSIRNEKLPISVYEKGLIGFFDKVTMRLCGVAATTKFEAENIINTAERAIKDFHTKKTAIKAAKEAKKL